MLVVGDRWKGENVATSEVADILLMAHGILEANVYGVKVEGKMLKAELVAPKCSVTFHLKSNCILVLKLSDKVMRGGSEWQLSF